MGAGAAACSPMTSVHRSLAIIMPEPPGDPLVSPPDLTTWLHSLTETMLPGLLRQADPQHVIEYSLALITVLNEVSSGDGRRREPALSGCALAQSNISDWILTFLQRPCPLLLTDKIPNLLEMTSSQQTLSMSPPQCQIFSALLSLCPRTFCP